MIFGMSFGTVFCVMLLPHSGKKFFVVKECRFAGKLSSQQRFSKNSTLYILFFQKPETSSNDFTCRHITPRLNLSINEGSKIIAKRDGDIFHADLP